MAWRMAVDFRDLNKHTIKDAHPLPDPREALAAIAKAKWFTAVDASSAFHQINMRSDEGAMGWRN